jgi:hypothetical protein
MHVSQTFERLLDAHRRPNGSRRTGQQLDKATGGVVIRSYATNLRKGRIECQSVDRVPRRLWARLPAFFSFIGSTFRPLRA